MNDAPLHPEYARVRFHLDAGVGPPEWPTRFAIITAWATTGEQWPLARNQEADVRLAGHLEDVWHLRLTGYSPRTGHAEPGYACDLGAAAARELGRAFLQDAIYLVQADRLSVTRCLDGSPTYDLGSFRARLDAP